MADKKVKKAKKTKVVKQKQSQRQTVNVNINTGDKRTKRTRAKATNAPYGKTTTTSRTITPRISGIPQSTNVVVHNNIPELQGLIQSMMPQDVSYDPEPNKLLKMKIPNELSSERASRGLTAPINIQPNKYPVKLPPEYFTPASTTPSLIGEIDINSLGQTMERRRKEEVSAVKIEKFLEKAVKAKREKKNTSAAVLQAAIRASNARKQFKKDKEMQTEPTTYLKYMGAGSGSDISETNKINSKRTSQGTNPPVYNNIDKMDGRSRKGGVEKLVSSIPWENRNITNP